jgi:hypothetical protein
MPRTEPARPQYVLSTTHSYKQAQKSFLRVSLNLLGLSWDSRIRMTVHGALGVPSLVWGPLNHEVTWGIEVEIPH